MEWILGLNLLLSIIILIWIIRLSTKADRLIREPSGYTLNTFDLILKRLHKIRVRTYQNGRNIRELKAKIKSLVEKVQGTNHF